MQYRKYAPNSAHSFDASIFGMGCMRPPMKLDADGKEVYDDDEYIRMIHTAMDNGVNYFDTAYVYMGGHSEEVLGQALATDGRRARVKIATKLPMWNAESKEDLRRLFEEELRRLQTDFIDVYLLHNMNKENWAKAKRLGALELLDELRAEGRIGIPAFSFHDDFETFKEVLEAYDWGMCQLQLNIIDTDYQATLEGMRMAAAKGMAVVIMEPLRGGMLANAPAGVQAIYDEHPVKRSPVEWAFRFMYNFPEVTTILSGVSSMEQLLDNLRIFDNAQPGVMDEAEQALTARVGRYYNDQMRIKCTGCAYCVPCPQGVEIPKIFSIWNRSAMFEVWEDGRKDYAKLVAEGKDASQCISCGACESACPQHLSIIEMLQQADSDLK